jgi:hypothetical protein
VKSLDLKNPVEAIHVERDAKDRDRWRVRVAGNLVRADSTRVEDLLHEFKTLEPKNVYPKKDVKPEERAKWGLDKPLVEATLAVEGSTVRVAFGGRTPEGRNAFAEKDGNGDVYVVRSATLDKIQGEKAETLREKKPLGFSSYEAKSLSLRRADGLRLEAEKATTSAGTWEVSVPWVGAADPTKFEPLLNKALGVEVAGFVADGAPDLEAFGLKDPSATISIRREGREAPVVLRLGKQAPDGRTYFMEDGEPSVYVCGPDLPKAIAELDPAALRDRNLLRIGWARIDAIEFVPKEHPETGWKLLRILDRWDVEKPERVPAEGPEVDRLLDDLRKTEVVKFLDGEEAEKFALGRIEDAAARLVLTGTDEGGNRTLLFGRRDAEGSVPVRLLPPKDAKASVPVAVLPPDLLDRLERGWLSFRDLDVLKVDPGEVQGISRRWNGEDVSFAREKGVWKAVAGGKEPDTDALTAALSHLLTLRCSAYEAKTKEGLEKWGLGEPPSGPVVTLRLKKESDKEDRKQTLVLGGTPEGGGSHYARLADGELVFRLPDNLVSGAEVVPFFELLTARWAKKEPEPAPPPGDEKPR